MSRLTRQGLFTLSYAWVGDGSACIASIRTRAVSLSYSDIPSRTGVAIYSRPHGLSGRSQSPGRGVVGIPYSSPVQCGPPSGGFGFALSGLVQGVVLIVG